MTTAFTHSATEKYQAALHSLPESGGGGCHSALLSVANLGVIAELSRNEIFTDLRQHVRGSRPVSDSEIRQAIEKAFSTARANTSWTPTPKPRIRPNALREIIRRGDGATEADLWEASPVRIDWPHTEDSFRVLEHLYHPDELLFIGDDHLPGVLGKTIRTCAEWIAYLKRDDGFPFDCPFPKIIPNPLTGKSGLTKSGKQSYRADACVSSFRFLVAEFDALSLQDQFAFWYGCPHLPVAAITHSGKKSLHAWIRVDAADAEEWTQVIERRLFPQFLKPLGLDTSCKNEGRLSRMPGHTRSDTGLPQKLLYLAPDGKAVSHAN